MENLKSQAESQLENSLYEACLETLMKILIISEQPELILVKIAQILIHIQKPQSAILALQESIMLDRSSPNLDAINMLANIYSSLNLHDAALVLFKNLFENDKTAISLYTRALVNCKKYYEVILVFRNYQTSDGIPRIELYNDAIFAFMQLDKFVEALELAKLVYESGLYITGIYLAECLLYLDDIDELGHAFEIFEKCVASIEKEKLLLITQQELPLQISFDDLNTSDEEVVVQDLLITINANDKRTSCDKDTKPQPISRPRKIKHQRFVPLSSQQKLTCLRKSQSRAFNGLAKLLMLKGRTEEALSSVSKAFMLSSNDPKRKCVYDLETLRKFQRLEKTASTSQLDQKRITKFRDKWLIKTLEETNLIIRCWQHDFWDGYFSINRQIKRVEVLLSGTRLHDYNIPVTLHVDGTYTIDWEMLKQIDKPQTLEKLPAHLNDIQELLDQLPDTVQV